MQGYAETASKIPRLEKLRAFTTDLEASFQADLQGYALISARKADMSLPAETLTLTLGSH